MEIRDGELIREEEELLLYYDLDRNLFVDDDGYTVFDIFKYVTPNELYLFKANKECMYFRKAKDFAVGLVWPV